MRRPNLVLVVLCLFCVVVFGVLDECLLCCVRFSFFSTSREIGREERLRNDLFCVEWGVRP